MPLYHYNDFCEHFRDAPKQLTPLNDNSAKPIKKALIVSVEWFPKMKKDNDSRTTIANIYGPLIYLKKHSEK